MRKSTLFSPPLLCSIGMLRCELRLRCCISVVVIKIYTRRSDRPNADLKIESTYRYYRRMKSNRGRFGTFQWIKHFYFVKMLVDAIHFLADSQVPRFSSFTSFFEFQIIVFWVVISCDFIWGYQCFRRASYFQLQGRISTLMEETALFSETLIFIGKTTRRHKPEHNNLNEHSH